MKYNCKVGFNIKNIVFIFFSEKKTKINNKNNSEKYFSFTFPIRLMKN